MRDTRVCICEEYIVGDLNCVGLQIVYGILDKVGHKSASPDQLLAL